MPNRTSAAAAQVMQGPRPPALKVAKDSHAAAKRRPAQQQQPVIIYVESPKVVHAHAAEFKSVVQRLTGAAPPAPSLWTTTTMLFPSSALPPPPPPPPPPMRQLQFELYRRAQEAQNAGVSCRVLPPPLVATSAAVPFASLPPGDAAAGRDVSYDQLLGSPFMQLDQSMAPPPPAACCGPSSSVHVNLPVYCSPLALPSLGAGHGDLFINQQ
ncbi:hypothetical protein ACP4OV_025899 [Aristida adscensionis]